MSMNDTYQPINCDDYDNLELVNGKHLDLNGQTTISSTITKSPISSELDQKIKEAIAAGYSPFLG